MTKCLTESFQLNEIQNKYPDITLALRHRDELIKSGKYWCQFSANSFKTEITYGSILSDGTHEKEIASRRYYIDVKTGEVKYITVGHL